MQSDDVNSRPWRVSVGPLVLAGCLCFVGAELTARVDDLIFQGVSLTSNPDRARDLLLVDIKGPRGRPFGHFQRWLLNEYGFRGPEIQRDPEGIRVVVLGASETFGLDESEGQDFLTLVRRKLEAAGAEAPEIVNAAFAGISLPTLQQYWSLWVQQFKPSSSADCVKWPKIRSGCRIGINA
jgi:hypothetical protein